ncbi:MAG: HK97 gp10 family phage protein [Bacilli bacterium]|nr:HK97 gp10 family phage protein [Bacilli bacterium]
MAYKSILDVNKILDSYAKDIAKDVTTDAEMIAKKGVEEIKAASPKRTGKYRRGWRVKTNKLTGHSTIYNATSYQLTHLLEYPHATRNGGITTPKSAGHIAKVEQAINKEFESDVIRIVQTGG